MIVAGSVTADLEEYPQATPEGEQNNAGTDRLSKISAILDTKTRAGEARMFVSLYFFFSRDRAFFYSFLVNDAKFYHFLLIVKSNHFIAFHLYIKTL